MEQKFTNVELYQWMVGQLSTLYFQSYQLAYDLAKQAEQAYRHELALPDATFIQFGYWDSLKKGLAGRRAPRSTIWSAWTRPTWRTTPREYEITRHVSLALDRPGGAARSCRPRERASSPFPRRCSTWTAPANTCAGSSRSA